jgi:hypothetical protein
VKGINPNTAILVGGGIVILLLTTGILKGTGLIQTPAPTPKIDLSKPPKVGTTICKSSYTAAQIRTGIFQKWAKQIFDAKGFFKDNEAAVYDIFLNKIKTRGDLYLLNQYFSLYHNGQIVQFINGFMSSKEIKPIYDRINRLPCNL